MGLAVGALTSLLTAVLVLVWGGLALWWARTKRQARNHSAAQVPVVLRLPAARMFFPAVVGGVFLVGCRIGTVFGNIPVSAYLRWRE